MQSRKRSQPTSNTGGDGPDKRGRPTARKPHEVLPLMPKAVLQHPCAQCKASRISKCCCCLLCGGFAIYDSLDEGRLLAPYAAFHAVHPCLALKLLMVACLGFELDGTSPCCLTIAMIKGVTGPFPAINVPARVYSAYHKSGPDGAAP